MPLSPPFFEMLEGAFSVMLSASRQLRHRPKCVVGRGFSSGVGQPGSRAAQATRRKSGGFASSWGMGGATGLRGIADLAGAAWRRHKS